MAKSKLSDKAHLPFKTENKQRRQSLHIKRKRATDQIQRAARFSRRKEEARDPRLREERLRRNKPATLDKKRVWDEATEDIDTGLGLSVDVERIKRQRLEEERTLSENADEAEEVDETFEDEGDNEDDDADSMLDDTSDEENESETEEGMPFKKPPLPVKVARAASPTQSTTSTNLSLAPEALAAKFPTLFNTESSQVPKILITTSINSTLHAQAKQLTQLFPHSVYIRRSAHRYGYKFSVREISGFATNRNYTSVLVLEEDQKRPSGLTVIHLPEGPTFHFSISNWVDGKKMPGHGNPTDHIPELILNNFRTPLGLLTAHLFRTLFPAQPQIQGRQVVTLHNQRDYIFLRRHRYIFREKRETEKSVTNTEGEAVKGVEDIRAGLQELGPRFTLKLRRIDKGIQRGSGQEWEWKGRMEKVRTKFQL
ncbi:putative rna processing factor 1 [Phaeomoniella chlamydospora]|uniref:Putative rna processing factor 1 n=1 Tax=Phaeomoniella chlamydospora TaxID=158046 RepID=A0A0G2E889_PHACM|nr:putative rna processing factor 1 [Phaeomoniella chlamydospora]